MTTDSGGFRRAALALAALLTAHCEPPAPPVETSAPKPIVSTTAAAPPSTATVTATPEPSATVDPIKAGDPALYSSAAPPIDADGRTVTKAAWETTFGPHSWSLTVDSGRLSCQMPERFVFLETPDKKRYALGTATRACTGGKTEPSCGAGPVQDVETITRSSAAGLPMSQVSLVTVGKKLCPK